MSFYTKHLLGVLAIVPLVLCNLESSGSCEAEESCLRRFDNCTSDQECDSFISNSLCDQSTSTCICPEGSILSSDRGKCLVPAQQYGDPCEDSLQCSVVLLTGGICENMKCVCGRGYHYLKGRCWKDVGMSEFCSQGEQCYASYESVGFECAADNTCQCREKYYDRAQQGCRKQLFTGEMCILFSDCFCGNENGDVTEGECVKRKCVCKNEALPIATPEQDAGKPVWEPPVDGKCKPGLFPVNGDCVFELGMECTNNSECSKGVKLAICPPEAGVCSCPSNTVASADNKSCLKVAIGELENPSEAKCTEDSVCCTFGDNAFCNSGKCDCREGTQWVSEEKLCWPIVGLNEACTVDKDCHVDSGVFATCKDQVCTCIEGYHQDSTGTDCRKDAPKLEDSCVENLDCTTVNSECNAIEHKCKCKDNFYVEDGSCKPGINSDCTEGDAAACTDISAGQCIDSFCQCLPGLVPNYVGSACLPVVNYNESCSESIQCSDSLGELVSCIDGTCLCSETAHYSKGFCFETKREKCKKRSECWTVNGIERTMCQNGICACQYKYIKTADNRCLTKKEHKKEQEKGSGTLVQSCTLLLISSYLVAYFTWSSNYS